MAVPWINSKTEICNIALAMLGDMRINAYEDTSDLSARLCRDHYDQVRDSLLRSALWSFATTRATLAAYASAPTFGEDYQYVLPADFLRMISLNDAIVTETTDEFRIEMIDNTKVLLTEEDTAQIRYIYRNDIPATYDAIFVRAFTSRLASALCFIITGDARLAEGLYIKAVRELDQAIHENANESKPTLKPITGDSGLVNARHTSAIG